MQPAIWIVVWIVVAVLAVAALTAGALRVRHRGRRTFVPTTPATPATPVTISVAQPVEETLESPREAAISRAEARAEAEDGGGAAGLDPDVSSG